MDDSHGRRRVVILGAGFAGLACARGLRDPRFEVVLVDRQNHHLFQPLLYQVATAGLSAPAIARPIRAIVHRQRNVAVRMDEVAGIDLDAREVRLERSGTLAYDILVIAVGAVTGYFGHAEWERHAPGLKTLDDALRIRRRLLLAFERAETCGDPEERARLMTVVVIGGGPTGVEMAGAAAELLRVAVKDDFRHIDPGETRVVLVEAIDRLLAMMPEHLSRYARERLERMGVEVRTRCPVEEIGDGFVRAGGETIEAATIIWAAGVRANPVVDSLGDRVPKDGKGCLRVESDLSLPGHPEVFAVGDVAHVVDRAGAFVPGVAPAAMQMGRHAAAVIRHDLRLEGQGSGEVAALTRPRFEYWDKGTMATIGRSAAVVAAGPMEMRGWPAWIAWLFVHLVFLVDFANKLLVLVQWFFAYVRYHPGARIITGFEGAPGADRGGAPGADREGSDRENLDSKS